MRVTQFIEYLRMEKAPDAGQQIEMTHITIDGALQRVRAIYRRNKPDRQIEMNLREKGLFKRI